jgi:hypothetical protein
MKKHILEISAQPHGLRIANEMDLMTPESQGLSELGGDDTTSSVCWITHYADFHETFLVR